MMLSLLLDCEMNAKRGRDWPVFKKTAPQFFIIRFNVL